MSLETKQIEKITSWIKSYASLNRKNLVVGVSGGVDSALVSTLCCMTGIKTHLVSLPINQNLNHLSRARNHISWLSSTFENVEIVEIDLTAASNLLLETFSGFRDALSDINTKSRLRMIALYQIAGSRDAIVVGTGNKVEDFGVGFFTKYGDGGVDISPIADLYKSEVKRLAKLLGVSEEITSAEPSDGLWDDCRSDEDQIGASYDELEWVMNYSGPKDLLTERQKKVIEIFDNFRAKNHHKMAPIPVLKMER